MDKSMNLTDYLTRLARQVMNCRMATLSQSIMSFWAIILTEVSRVLRPSFCCFLWSLSTLKTYFCWEVHTKTEGSINSWDSVTNAPLNSKKTLTIRILCGIRSTGCSTRCLWRLLYKTASCAYMAVSERLREHWQISKRFQSLSR